MSEEVSMVISDVMMPEMSGKELCYKIKKQYRTILYPRHIAHSTGI